MINQTLAPSSFFSADSLTNAPALRIFEAYISNPSLYIVQHRERQILEVLRVLKPESCLLLTTKIAILLCADLATLKQKFADAVLTDVRMWFKMGY